MTRPTTIEQACAMLAAEFSMGKLEAQQKLGPSMLEALISKGYAVLNPKNDRVGPTRMGGKAAKAYRPEAVATVDEELG